MSKLGMDKANNVIVAGSSTGAISTYIWVDYFRNRIMKVNNRTRVVGIPDFFILDYMN